MHKVLHMLNYLGNGGSEKYIYSLAKRLHGKTCEFFIAYSEDGPGRAVFKELGIRLLPLRMKNPFDIKAALELKKICGSLSIDTVHTHFLRENYIGVISKIIGNKVRLINTRHMLLENSKSVVLANRIFTRFNYRIIAVSRHVQNNLLKEGIRGNKISMIHNGVDPDEWNSPDEWSSPDKQSIPPEQSSSDKQSTPPEQSSSDKQITPDKKSSPSERSTPGDSSFRKAMGISDDEILITSVARFSPEKGHDFIIEVIKYFRDNIQNYISSERKYRFILAGDGPMLGEIKEKASKYDLENDIIFFVGYISNIKELLKDSDIFIAHSKSEAFGIAILEAMASGLPVITTDSGGTAEIVNDEYRNGILTDYGDIKKYADSLALLVNNEQLRKQYAENGLIAVRNHFSLDKTAHETYNLYVANAQKEERRQG